mmetsp:Transcript_32930/g.81855  ORF Transcript_32930/g.81855 Transcript_32930/m.81855 type:complete len:236 (+) Transcript_32930:283-990(+)
MVRARIACPGQRARDMLRRALPGPALKRRCRNVPIGVLVDQCVGVDDGSSHPWRLTAHFSNFPSEILLRGGGVMDTAATAAHYINTLKESTYLRFGSTQPIMSLSTDAQRQLQRAVEFGRFDDYAAVRAQLLPHAPVTDERRRKVRLAIRLCQDDGPWIQPALSVLDEDGVKPRVLGDVLCAALPHANSEKVALIHGVPAPLNAPVDWLSAACAHPDGFLYVVVRSRIQPSANTS